MELTNEQFEKLQKIQKDLVNDFTNNWTVNFNTIDSLQTIIIELLNTKN